MKLPFNLYSVPVIKPLDSDSLIQICHLSRTLITVEEHILNGGFGSAILEIENDLYNQGKIKKRPIIYRYGVGEEIITDMTSEVFSKQIFDKIKDYV